jgi:transposase
LSRFKTFLEYKSKNAGLDFYKVDEAYTSQLNCATDKREFSSNLSIREVQILPNIKIDRDLNSAINIAKKVKGKWFTQLED